MDSIKICRFLSHSDEEVFMKSLDVMIKALRCPNSEMGFRYFQSGFYKFIISKQEDTPIHHLFQLNKIMMDLYNKISESDDLYDLYQEYFMILMEFMSLPLHVPKMKYLTVYYEDIVESYNYFAFILKNTQRIEIVRKVLGALILHASNRKIMGYKNTTTIKALITSKLPEAISELLATSDFETYLEYLAAMEKLLNSNLECETYLKLNVINTIFQRLSDKWVEESYDSDEEIAKSPIPVHLNLSQRVVWILILAYKKSSQEFKDNCGMFLSKTARRIIRSTFVKIICLKKRRKERNMLYLLCRIMIGLVPYESYNSRLTYDTFYLVFSSEIPVADKSTWYSKVKFYPDKLDFDFKISLMSVFCLKEISPIRNTPQILRNINAIPAILMILNDDAELLWTPTQRKDLIYYALIVLQNIVGIDLEHFFNHGGPKRLIQVFNKILNEPHQAELLFQVLCCINKSIILDNYIFDEVSEEYEQSGIFKLIESLLSSSVNLSAMCITTQHCLGVVYCILEKMMTKFSRSMSQITKSNLELLRKAVHLKFMSGFFRPFVLIAIMNYFWKILAYYDDGYFIKNGGIYLLLDIIEKLPLAIKMLGLSILSDFCQYSNYLTCMLTWRGSRGDSFMELLMRIYRQQAEFDQKNCNSKYLTQDDNPSLNDKSDHKFKLSKTKTPSLVVLDILSSCKPKIASILHIISCSEQTQLINECYQVSKMDLSYDDKITGALAKLYYNLKLGEAWIEIDNFFKFQGIRPLVFDQLLLCYHIEEYNRCLRGINFKQRRYQEEKENKELRDEYIFYNRLKEQQLSVSLDSLQELRRIAISSKKQFTIEEYKKMIKQLAATKPENHSNLHTTIADGVHVNVYDHRVNKLSDIVINLNEEKAPKTITSVQSFTDNIFDTTTIENDYGCSDNFVQDITLRCSTLYLNRDASK